MKFPDVVTALIVIASTACVKSSFALADNPLPSLELKYFNARGAAETSRIILALGEANYKDTRYDITPGTMDAPGFTAAKEAGDLTMNLKRAPVLKTLDGVIGQSRAIERYLARKFGLMGNTEIEEASIDCIAEHCRDVRDAAMRKGFSVFTRDKTDEEKAQARSEWFETDMPTMLSKIEEVIKLTSHEKGYAVGSETSYADIAIFSLLMDCTMQADQEDTTKAAEHCEELVAIAERIKGDPRVAKWLEARPVTNF